MDILAHAVWAWHSGVEHDDGYVVDESIFDAPRCAVRRIVPCEFGEGITIVRCDIAGELIRLS